MSSPRNRWAGSAIYDRHASLDPDRTIGPLSGVPLWARWISAILLMTGGLALPQSPAVADRVAFVVGIDIYDNLPSYRQLKNSVNDARAVANTFAELGYQLVVDDYDPTLAAFYGTWQSFLDRVQKDDIAVIFVSGHGIEIDSQNFILPRDAPFVEFGRQERLKHQSISISDILLDLRKRGPKLTVLILDACRDNPFIPPEYKSAMADGGGLAKMEPAEGEFIMYSAGAGQSSLDRLPGDDGVQHSLYVQLLLPLMKQDGLTLNELARTIKKQVRDLARTVSHTQLPAYYDNIIGDFCFGKCDGGVLQQQQPLEAYTFVVRNKYGDHYEDVNSTLRKEGDEWREYQKGVNVFNFAEVGRDENFIYLKDESRGLSLAIPINGGASLMKWDSALDWTKWVEMWSMAVPGVVRPGVR